MDTNSTHFSDYVHPLEESAQEDSSVRPKHKPAIRSKSKNEVFEAMYGNTEAIREHYSRLDKLWSVSASGPSRLAFYNVLAQPCPSAVLSLNEQSTASVDMETATNYNLPHEPLSAIFGFQDTHHPIELPALHVHNANSVYPHKSAFTVNSGINASCLTWSISSSSIQTLAVAGAPRLTGTSIYSQSTGKNHIQLWEFERGNSSGITSARLKALLLHEWGNVLDLQFSPIYPDLIGGIFEDGSFRVVKLPEMIGKYVIVKTPAFSVTLAKTAITSFCWYDSKSICVGCANGFVAKYNIPNEMPTCYHQIHDSYIDKIVPASNGLIITHSYDCFTKLVDLNSLTIRTNTRSRYMHYSIAACQHYPCVLHSSDGSLIRFSSIRRLNEHSHLYNSEGTVTDIATSPLHPYIATSSTDGIITIINIASKLAKNKAKTLIRRIAMLDHNRKINVYRMLENFRVEEQKPGARDTNHRLYPVEIMARRVSWNPNVECGTWLACSFANGIFRVEDLEYTC